ncbi:MAG: hypothetical protein Q8O99_08360 [bacterium]|nr:hypothetical protein [bacterium]
MKKKTTLEEIYARLRKQNQNILAGNTMKEEVVENNSALTTVDLVGSLATSVQVPETPTEITNTSARVSKFDNYTIQRSRNSDSTDFEVNKVITLTIDITDNFGNPISTVLSYPISLTINQSTIGSVFPNSFSNVINGKKYLFLQTKQLGTATITLWIGGHKLGEEKITVK